MHDSDSGGGFFHAVPIFLVDDVIEAADYYRDQLCFEVNFLYGEPPTYGSVSRGEVSVNFSKSVPPGRRNGMAGAGPGSGADVYVIVGGIDELYEELRAREVNIVRQIESYDYGMREFVIEDPNGYRLVFGQGVAEHDHEHE
jgi:uncharacterized glyoxalase superfamily protein PhnB